MNFQKLNKQQKTFLIFVLPTLLIIVVVASNFIFSDEKPTTNEQELGINTALPRVASNLQNEKVSAYKKEEDQVPTRKTDFVLENYEILSEKKEDENTLIKEQMGEKETKEKSSGETSEDGLLSAKEKINAERKALEEFDENETYDEDKVEKKVRARNRTPENIHKENSAASAALPPSETTVVSFNSISVGKKATQSADDFSGTIAYIHGDQTAYHGGTVKIRIGKAISLPSLSLPVNSFLYGTCTLAGERMNIKIQRAQVGNKIVNCSLIAFGTDGNQGIYVPGSVLKEENKKSSGKSLKKVGSVLGAGVNIATGGILGSVAETATEGVIDAVTTGAAKNVQQIKVFLPNNERIYLK